MKKINLASHSAQVMVLLFIIFIDGVGLSLVLPLIGDLFSSGSHSLLDGHAPKWLNTVYYGLSLASFSIAMIFGASLLGQFSDKKGRKLTLRISLIGAFFGYVACAIAVLLRSPILFIIGRTVDGLTAGSVPVAQAVITDLDEQANKMTGIGMVMFVLTSGYMLGPLIASVAFLGSETSHYLPFILVSICCLICLKLVNYLQETNKSSDTVGRFDVWQAFASMKAVFSVTSIRFLLLGFFLFQCAWTLFYQYLPLIVIDGKKLEASHVSMLMASVGFMMCFTFCYAVGKVQAIFTSMKIIFSCLIGFIIFSACALFLPLNLMGLYMIALPLAFFYALGYSALLGYMLEKSESDVKGMVLGSLASICALSAAITALFGGYLTAQSQQMFLSFLLLISLMATGFFAMSTKSRVVSKVCD